MPINGILDHQAPAGVAIRHFGRHKTALCRFAPVAADGLRPGIGTSGSSASEAHRRIFKACRRAILQDPKTGHRGRFLWTATQPNHGNGSPDELMNSELVNQLALNWGIQPADVPDQLLAKSIPWPQRLAFHALVRIWPALFKEDRSLISEVLSATNREQVVATLRGMHRTPGQSGNYIRHSLQIRASGRRLLRLTALAFHRPPASSQTSAQS